MAPRGKVTRGTIASVPVQTCGRDATITRHRGYLFFRKDILASSHLFTLVKKRQDRVPTTVRISHCFTSLETQTPSAEC
jgi:hypothetical protein